MRWLPALAALVLAARDCAALFLPDSPELQRLLSRYGGESDQNQTGTGRARRGIEWSDRKEILKLHNKLRGGVYPSASNMEYMVWDDALEQSAARWAGECMWEHGPKDLLVSIGQNLAVHWGRYRSPAQQVHSWYDEVKDYTYPYSHECNPWCPDRCSGSMCTHYTQLVWATTSRLGCAVRLCPRMNVWGEVWENAVYLVCNYSPKGNWIGEAPYKHGHPCSQCPPSYGGGCRENLCHKDPYTPQRPETEDMNEVEKVPIRPRTTTTKPSPKLKPKARPTVPKKASAPKKNPAPKKPSSAKKPSKTKSAANPFLTQNINCGVKMRDKCKGARCNRYKCPANCQKKGGKLWGTSFYDVQSSICRAAIHSGAIDNNGGLVDITRKDKLPFFVKATKNGVESFSKYKPGNAFVVVKVKEQPVDCYTTVAEICAFKKPASTCPRVFCASNCKNEPSYWAPVIGTNIYADGSSICRAATHAGVIQASGGYVDVLPLDKKKSYMGSLRNGIQSESKSNWEGGSFSVFLVKE